MADTTTNVVVITESREEEVAPRSWEAQRANLEDRMNRIETRLEENNSKLQENNSYLEKLVNLMSAKEGEQSPATQQMMNQVILDTPVRRDGKQPMHITVIDEKEKYPFKANEPGILSTKPSINLGEPSYGKDCMQQEKNYLYGGSGTFIPRPKIELQLFDGNNLRGWVKKCHQCKLRQLNYMEEGEELQEEAETEHKEDQLEKGDLEISINALTGSTWYSTLRIRGFIKGKPLSILVDSGSTHSFIIPRWAKEGMEVVQTNPLAITVANGEQLYSTTKSNLLTWKMQGHSFTHNFRVLRMGGSDMVLGVDWMKQCSPIMMDFKNMTLSFQVDDQKIILQGGEKLQKSS
ncbi:hypothetical protein GQ457_04G013260 [Hibiscus cannabinus]